MQAPPRVQITWRKAGGVKPAGVIVCARPSAYGNPYPINAQTPRHIALFQFREYATARHAEDPGWLAPLAGADGLACYCKAGEECHVDIIRELLEK